MTCCGNLFQLFKARVPNAVMRADEPLSKHTTLRVGGCADVYVEPSSEDELRAVLELCRHEDVPWLLIGRGSNLLVRDGGVRGVVICLAHPSFSAIHADAPELRCGAGARIAIAP